MYRSFDLLLSVENRRELLASIHSALVGEIDTCMKAIYVTCDKVEIKLSVFVDDTYTEEVLEDFDGIVISQIMADFPLAGYQDPAVVKVEFFKVPDPLPTLPNRGVIVFRKKNVVILQE